MIDVIKCKHCGKCFISSNQTKCPFCEKDLQAPCNDPDLPEGFADIFGFNKK